MSNRLDWNLSEGEFSRLFEDILWPKLDREMRFPEEDAATNGMIKKGILVRDGRRVVLSRDAKTAILARIGELVEQPCQTEGAGTESGDEGGVR